MKLCPQCENENPSSANHCMFCGSALSLPEEMNEMDKLHRELLETKKTNDLLKSALELQLKKEEEKEKNTEDKTEIPAPVVVSVTPVREIRGIEVQPEYTDTGNRKTINLIIVLAVAALVVFGIFYYFNFYLPAKVDREAPRYYTFANRTNLRSSQESGVDYNKVTTLNYGSELITYTHNDMGWSEVKDHAGNKGFISSELLLTGEDFTILNNMFGDEESKECINTIKCRSALLSYYKRNNLTDDWKIFCRPPNTKPNNVFFTRLYDKTSKYTDFAVIIKNIQTNKRMVLVFGFNDDESVAWAREGEAPADGYIKNISVIYSGRLNVEYSN